MNRLILILMLLAGLNASAREEGRDVADSMMRLLLSDKYRNREDTDKVQLLCYLSFAIHSLDPGNGIVYAQQALALSQKLRWRHGIALSYCYLGDNYDGKSDYHLAIDCYLKALTMFEELHEIKNIGLVQGDIGIIYVNLENYQKAMEYELSALNIGYQLNDTGLITMNLPNIATIHLELKSYDSALGYYSKGLEIAKQAHDVSVMNTCLANMGAVYMEQRQYNKALACLFPAMRITGTLDEVLNLAHVTGNIGTTYLRIITDTTANTHPDSLVSAQNTVNLRKAYEYLSKSLALAREIDDVDRMSSSLEPLAQVYELMGDHKAAYNTYRQYAAIRDSIRSNDVRLKVANLETTRQVELKDKQIAINRLAVIQKRNERIIFASGIALLIVAVGGVYRNYSNQKKAKEKQQATNRLLEESIKQKEMLMREIHHRVKNNLQVITTLLDLQLANINDTYARGAITESTTRLKAISLIHHQLYRDDYKTTIECRQFAADLHTQVSAIFVSAGQQVTLNNEAPPIVLDIDTAVPLGLILNELMTNSYKYAFAGRNGHIDLRIMQNGDSYCLQYKDSGPGLPQELDMKKLKSLGIMIMQSLAKQIGGSFTYDAAGKTFIITFMDAMSMKKMA